MSDDWQHHARDLAASVTHPVSRWRPVIAGAPRHLFVPRWFEPSESEPGWAARVGVDRAAWFKVAYCDQSVITRVGAVHADEAEPGAVAQGGPTSSATLPSLLVQMYDHAMLGEGMDVLDAGTGSGYGAWLLASLYGDRVLSCDVDPYLVEASILRCREAGMPIRAEVLDVTGELPGEFDRIIATVFVPHVPASWVKALRPGGRVVTTLADTALILVLDKQEDGTLKGRTAWDRAGFMVARHDCGEHEADPGLDLARSGTGETHRSAFPVVDVPNAWPLWSTFNLENPGVRHQFTETDGVRRALMWADDGAWARAEDTGDGEGAMVFQGGPRRLWDALDELRKRWLRDGDLPCYGARVRVNPDGTTILGRGRGGYRWRATRTASAAARPM